MGILPMVHVLVHFGGTPKQQSRQRESFERPSLARLLYRCAVCVRTRTMGWKPMLRPGGRTHAPQPLRVRRSHDALLCNNCVDELRRRDVEGGVEDVDPVGGGLNGA